ncbi:DUF4259 domain-containing protein [Streptomyces anulatus]
MGTWGVGPFANDTAADFAGYLDEAAVDDRESMIRRQPWGPAAQGQC